MKIGFSLPNIGPIGTAEAITKVAQRAEALGYSSLWTIERLLYPVKLQSPYPATPDGHLPEIYRQVLDPLDALTYVAAQTKRIRLGTSVLDIPYHNPVVLARRLSTIDVLSNGRLSVGFGLGWSKDEMDATGADMKTRGALADEFLPLLKAIWTTNPVEFRGKFFTLPKSYIDLKPVQKQMFGSIRQMAREAGRDPSALRMLVHGFVEITDRPLGADRPIFSGTLEQISEDVGACAKIGADEVSFDPAFAPGGQSLDHWLSLLEQLKGMMTV